MAGKLIKDWFGRRVEDSYTFRNEERLFDWDNGRSSLSSFFFTRSSGNVKNASKMLGSMFRVMGAKKSKLAHENMSDKRKMESIVVPLSMLKNEDGVYTDNVDHLDAFYGASIQNAALKLFQSESDYNKTILSTNTDRGRYGLNDLLFSVLNTERIDKKLSERYPGYAKFVQKYKDYKFDENYVPVTDEDAPRKRLLDLVLRMLRYPAHLEEDELEEFKKPMQAMQRLLKKFDGMPKTGDDCRSMARSLANIVYKYTEEEEEESGSSSPESNGEDDSEGGGESTPSTPSKNKDELTKEELNELAKEYAKSLMTEVAEETPEAELDDILNEFEESLDEDNSNAFMHQYGEGGEDEESKIKFIEVSKGNKERYFDILKRINTSKFGVLRKLLERKNKDYQFVLKSMRSGRLDGNKIAEAVQKVPTIYERIGQVKSDKICVGVLIDESGSMGCSGRIKRAQEGAILINEIFKKSSGVDLFIYGHTADQMNYGDTDIYVYKENDKSLNPYALSQVSAKSNNRDGHAILAVARKIRKKTDRKGVLFVLSDGQPAASSYHDQKAIDDTRKKVKMAEKLGFQVIQIAIEECVPSSEMFTHYVKMTDIDNLPVDLTMYLSKHVDKLIKENVYI